MEEKPDMHEPTRELLRERIDGLDAAIDLANTIIEEFEFELQDGYAARAEAVEARQAYAATLHALDQ